MAQKRRRSSLAATARTFQNAPMPDPAAPPGLRGRVAAIRRHPVKGFTPEPLAAVALTAGAPFPCDRLYAVEDGPSGFDAAAPAYISKTRFTVLARRPAIARVRTRFDEPSGVLTAEAPGREPFLGRLSDPGGRAAFAAWLAAFIAAAEPDDPPGALKVLEAPGHNFFDHRQGAVSLVNLASVRDLADRVGADLEPDRFRANVYVEGWPALSELEHPAGTRLRLGSAELEVLFPIRRCAATHVDPARGERDHDLVSALRDHYGHMFCGLYLRVVSDGRVGEGDAATLGDAP